MCFNKEFSLGFTILSTACGLAIVSGMLIFKNTERWRRIRMSSCFFFFAFMEFLQFVQYLVINQCDNRTNIVWTALGWLHICWQPVFSNIAFSAMDRKNLKRERDETWRFIIRYSIIAGSLMALRIVIPTILPVPESSMCTSDMEGVCGPETCSTDGVYHLKWTFRMMKPDYTMPNIAAHFLNMFIAPILMGQYVGSVVLFLSGPAIALLFKVSSGEQSSIWCFFSIMECALTMLTQFLVMRRGAKEEKQKTD